jgi:hypothetical protein
MHRKVQKMKSLHLIRQLESSRLAIGLILIVSTILIGAVWFLHLWKGIPIGHLTRDPHIIVSAPLYTGFLSQVGIFFWSASAAICIFTAKLLSKKSENLKIKRFLIVSGMLTLVLGLDDAFLLHEGISPYLGISEKAIFASYGGFVLFYLVRFYSIILKTEYVLLGLALFFFGLSIALDVIDPQGIDPFLFEDGAKLVGIVSWLAYFFRTSTSVVHHNVNY